MTCDKHLWLFCYSKLLLFLLFALPQSSGRDEDVNDSDSDASCRGVETGLDKEHKSHRLLLHKCPQRPQHWTEEYPLHHRAFYPFA